MVVHTNHPSTQEAGAGGYKFKAILSYKILSHGVKKKCGVGVKYLKVIIGARIN